jgi:hypothetical protein
LQRLLWVYVGSISDREVHVMSTQGEYDEYLAELREQVCTRCIERQPGNPPCAPHGRACGIEQHVPELVEICRSINSSQMEPYIERLHDEICSVCKYRDEPICPCPLDYLLQLAVEAVERVEQRRAARQSD